MVPESCHPYTGYAGSCSTCDPASLKKTYKVADYRFIGGAYGKSNEKLIMTEIMKNGPVVLNFEPAMDFMYYKKGIYHSLPAAKWVMNKESKPVNIYNKIIIINKGMD
jgi:cathepsin C